MNMLPALTICQPYAHLIIVDQTKRVENRTWATKYRGPLLIHAGKSKAWMTSSDRERTDFEFGKIIGVVELVDCLPIADIRAGKYDAQYPWISSHEHCFGPFCWVLAAPLRLDKSIPCKGQLGLFVPSFSEKLVEGLA